MNLASYFSRTLEERRFLRLSKVINHLDWIKIWKAEKYEKEYELEQKENKMYNIAGLATPGIAAKLLD